MIDKITKLRNEWKLQEIIDIGEDYLISNPNDYEVIEAVMNSYWHLGNYEKQVEYAKILLDNNQYSKRAMQVLIHAYSRIGKKEEARKHINEKSQYGIIGYYELLKYNLYETEAEKRNCILKCIFTGYDRLIYGIKRFSGLEPNGIVIQENDMTIKERIKCIEKIIKISELLYEEDQYTDSAFEFCNYYTMLALLYLHDNEKDKSINALHQAYDYALCFDTYDNSANRKSMFNQGFSVNPQTMYNKTAKVSLKEDLLSDIFNERVNEETIKELLGKLNN